MGVDLNELGNRVDEMTERPIRSGEQRAMQSAGEEIALEADPVSMKGGSGISQSPDQPSASEKEGGVQEEQGERQPVMASQTEPSFYFEPVSMEEVLDRLIDVRRSRLEAKEIDQVQNDFLMHVGAGMDPRLSSEALEHLRDQEVDALRHEFRRLVREHAAGRMLHVTQTRAPRRKHIDPRGTVRRMTRTGGTFNGFAYRPSPSESPTRVDAQHLLVIADVSGSMGRYVGVVLYLLSCLEELATVDSYIFSDATTYASDLLGTGDFHEQFTRLKEGALSWEYGTRLSQALADVIRDRRFHASTRVLLLTDGGFSLLGTDWPDTVHHLLALHDAVERIHLVTPNPQLIEEGPACADALWNVENATRSGHDLLTPDMQKTARYGLLTRYSANTTLCQTPADLLPVLQALLD